MNELCAENVENELETEPRLSRRDRRRMDTREEILVAARELLLEVGPEAISLRQVARRADFSPAALYNYFSSRDEIIVALFDESFERLNAYLKRVPVDVSPKKRLIELGMAYMEFARDNPMDLRCILASTSREGVPPANGVAIGLDAAHLIGETLRQGIQEGSFPKDSLLSVTEMAYAIWALVHGMTLIGGLDLSRVADDVSAEPRRVLEAFVSLLMTPEAR